MWLAAVFPIAASAEIRIGLAVPLSGRMAGTGLAMKAALEAAVAEANAAGGVLGERVALLVEDDGCAGASAEGAASVLIAQKPALVIGHPCSGAATAVAALYGQAGVLLITVGARHPDVTRTHGPVPVLRLAGRDDRQGQAAAAWLLAHAPARRVGIIHDRTGYARGIADGAMAALKASGVEPVANLPIVASKRDYEDTVRQLRDSGAESVLFAGYPDEAAIVVAAIGRLGLAIPLIGSDALATEGFARIAERAPGRVEVLLPREPAPRAGTNSASRGARTNGGDTDTAAGARARGAFEAWTIIAGKSGSTEGATLAPALKGARIDTPSLGEIGFDANGDLDAAAFAAASARSGQWIGEY